MGRTILVLPDAVANQIAAGEVVERPASVVKELVENALDAGAGRVEVRIEQGGKRSIRVADDGSGMGREDALLSLDRHATSKIREADDLRGVGTFGFRGEALPSIASVSRFSLETRSRGEEVGTRVTVRGGMVTDVSDHPRKVGTTVQVDSLFFNAPARAKFLRPPAAETRAVNEALIPLALAHPRVTFLFHSDDRPLLELPGTESLSERVAHIWGEEAASALIPVEAEGGGVAMAGLVQRPDAARPGFRRAHLFVEGRPFRDAALLRAADRGYRTTIPPDHRPWVLLFLRVPRGTVDVNVHPTKAEVRFRDRSSVERLVEEGVRSALEGEASAALFQTSSPDSAGSPGRPPSRPMGRERPSASGYSGAGTSGTGTGAVPGARTGARASTQEEGPEGEEAQMALFLQGRGSASQGRGAGVSGAYSSETDSGGTDSGEAGEDWSAASLPEQVAVEGLDRPRLWQVHRAWILAEVRNGILLIDQHAAHERVLFERIMARFDEGGAGGQRLLFPLTIRLTPPEVQMVDDLKGLLHRTGFEVELFGGDTVILHAVPDPHPYFDAEGCFREIVEELTHGSELVRSARNQHERLAMSFACKAAIKAGQALDDREVHELFDQLFATRLPYHDVHGRPTTVRLSRGELERKFGR
ncbi:MAG: DNA mismatch repair endonuclease MutL [Gemmatimonadales bacterium]|nr:MAG: DNA mismatch repair endonuclease MutL [Gemmatimonadales bacterium]